MKPIMRFSFNRIVLDNDMFSLSPTQDLARRLNIFRIKITFDGQSKNFKIELEMFAFCQSASRTDKIIEDFISKEKDYKCAVFKTTKTRYTIDHNAVFEMAHDQRQKMLSDFLHSMLDHINLSPDKIVKPLLEFLKDNGYTIQLNGSEARASSSVASGSGFFPREDENECRIPSAPPISPRGVSGESSTNAPTASSAET